MAKNKLPPLDQLLVVREMRELVLKGYRTKDLYVFAQKKFGLSKPQIDRYIHKVREDFMQIDTKTKGQLRAKYRERLEMLFHDALNVKKDIKLALDLQKELNKLISDPDVGQHMPDISIVFKTESDND